MYLAQGRVRAALKDLSQVIQIQPECVLARSQRGIILIQLGQLHEAQIELEAVLKKDPTNPEAKKYYATIGGLKEDYKKAYMFYSKKEIRHAIFLFTKIIEVCTVINC